MLGFARWKIILTLTVCLLGAALAAPNLLSRQQAEALPAWLPHRQISLGLDLQGGSHLLLQVDVQAVVRERMESLLESMRDELRKARIRYQDLRLDGQSVTVTILGASQIDEASEALRKLDPDVQVEQAEGQFRFRLTEQAVRARESAAVDQSLEIIRRRIDDTGLRDP